MESDLKSESNGSLRSYREIATQTEWTCGWNGWEFPPPFIFPYPTPNKTQMASFLSDNALVGKHLLDLNNEDDEDEDEDGCDVEYEEITLHLNTHSDRLGLCFVGPDDQTNDVLVTEIEAESVAAKDGRIQEGDQILQINGMDVKNSCHAIELFSRCPPSEFTILVCRAPSQLHEAYTYIQQHHQSKLDKCQYSPLHYHNHVVGNIEGLLVDDANEINSASVTLIENNFLEKDSGVGRTDESTKNDESCTENDKLSINNGTMDSGHSQNTSETSSGDNSNVNESQLKCEVNKDVCNAYNYSGINDINIKQFSSDTSLDREMALLHQEMQSIQLECESLINKRLHQNQVKQNNVAIDDNFHYQNRQKYIQHTYMNLDDIRPNVSPNSSLINKSEKSAHNNEKNFNCETIAEQQTINGNKLNSITSSNSNQRSNLPKEKKESVERWIKNMPTSTSTSTSTPVSNRKATKLGFSKPNMCEDKERDSSSAYNTGESSRSTPLTLELTPLPVASNDSKEIQNDNSSKCYYRPMMSLDLVSPCKGMEDKSTQLHESDVASIWSCESCRRCCRSFLESRETLLHQTQSTQSSQPQNRVVSSKRSSSESSKPSPQSQSPVMRKAKCDTFDANNELERNRNYVRMYPTMYTNEANLEHTIWLQQQLFREALAAKKQFTDKSSNRKQQYLQQTVSHKPQMSSFPNIAYSSSKIVKDSNFMSTFGISVPPSPSKSAPLTSTLKANNENNIKMEWKVKRRPDGTRYITRRPVRNKILKERALKIMEERCSGLTTDDDAISELKIGRYWPKDERKRHFEKSRARKREIMMRTTKMAALREHSEEREIPNTNNGSLARNLTQYRDSNTKRNKLTEIVRNSNSTNSSNSGKQILSNGILSVTTV